MSSAEESCYVYCFLVEWNVQDSIAISHHSSLCWEANKGYRMWTALANYM